MSDDCVQHYELEWVQEQIWELERKVEELQGNVMNNYPKVTRVEVIDNTGRAYMEYNAADVQVSFQDDGKTLKVFLKNLNKDKQRGLVD